VKVVTQPNNNSSLETPILVIAFNRPDLTYQLFEALRQIKPKRLYVAIDGARNEEEKERVEKVKDVFRSVDWECEVKQLYRKENLGCKRGVKSAIDWLFENEEQGIILEDDCIPDPSFCSYAESALNHYKDEEKVFMIAGSNFHADENSKNITAYFSKIAEIWGWATWRRAWAHYIEQSDFKEEDILPTIEDALTDKGYAAILANGMVSAYNGQIDTWDYQWWYTILVKKAFVLKPPVNLICNIGYGEFSTHIKEKTSFNEMPLSSLRKNVKFPGVIRQNRYADFVDVKIFRQNRLLKKSIFLYLKFLYSRMR